MSNFYAELEGIDKVLSKLAKLQNIDRNSPELIQSINREAMESMARNTSSQGFPKSSQSCGFKMSGKFGEVGYFTKFNDWKELWFPKFRLPSILLRQTFTLQNSSTCRCI